jgi:glutamine phosphoribosylpyrophosphate amidotransferase
MCGIAGFSISKKDHGTIDTERLARELLLGIEHRGRDATGWAAWNPAEGKILHDKAAVTASKFVADRNRFVLTTADRNVILHTRFGTKGSEQDPANNHPILVDNETIAGVHNGIVTNDDDLFDRTLAPRIAQVDSEAIFACLAYGGFKQADGSRTFPGVTATLAAIEGSAAIAWFDTNDDHTKTGRLHLARMNGSPLHVAQTSGYSLIFASTMAAVRRAAAEQDLTLVWEHDVPEGTYLQVMRGQIVSQDTFTPARSRTYVPKPPSQPASPVKKGKGGHPVTVVEGTNGVAVTAQQALPLGPAAKPAAAKPAAAAKKPVSQHGRAYKVVINTP